MASNMGDERNMFKCAECKEGHLHAVKSQFLNDILIRNVPMSYMFHPDITRKDHVLVSDTLKTASYECPINVVYLQNSLLFDHGYSMNKDEETAPVKSTIALEENMLNVMKQVKQQQNEILNHFKIETDTLLKNLKLRFDEVHVQLDDLALKIDHNKAEMVRLNDNIVEARNQINHKSSRISDYADYSSNVSDTDDEIRAIRNDPKKTFLNYLRSNGKHWEVDQPIMFAVYINGTSIHAVYDPFVAKSIVSQDLISSHDEVIDLNTEQVFHIPWRCRTMQSCYEASTVQLSIRNHKHTLKVSISPYWSRKVLLGLNFGVKFVDCIKKHDHRIILVDDHRNYFGVDYEIFERGVRDDLSEAMST